MKYTRRKIIFSMPLLAITSEIFAESLLATPRQTSGPFFPDKLPLDKDNDLIIINNSLTQAVGEILHLSGQIIDTKGRLVKDALVEIWQTDANGRYIHSRDYQEDENDKNFQGYGLFHTDATGTYRFRTIRPVAYGSGFGRRAPHIHFSVTTVAYKPLTSQIYFADEDNSEDGLYTRLSESQRKALSIMPQPIENSNINEQAATFNIILS